MANEENLIPQAHKLTVEDQSKGGIASGKKRKADKSLKTLANLILNTTIKDPEGMEFLQSQIDGLGNEQVTRGASMLAKIFAKANKDNASIADLMKAFELLRDTAGQKPVDKQEISNVDKDGFLRVVIDGVDISEDDDK